MGNVIPFPTPRRDHVLLSWDTAHSDCRIDIVRRSGAKEYVASHKDYLTVLDAARKIAAELGLPLVDPIEPCSMRRR